jgi:hypothetical protein
MHAVRQRWLPGKKQVDRAIARICVHMSRLWDLQRAVMIKVSPIR